MSREVFETIYRQGFPDDTPQQVRFFMDKVYSDDQALIGYSHSGEPVSCLLLRQLEVQNGSETYTMAYICGATTLSQYRSQGFMGQLLNQAFDMAQKRGDLYCSLIPASDSLRGYYSRFGFKNAFSAPSLPDVAAYPELTRAKINADDLYAPFNCFQQLRKQTILHSREDFSLIIQDNQADKGKAIAMQSPENEIVAIAFAVPSHDGGWLIKDALGKDNESVAATIYEVSDGHGLHFPNNSAPVGMVKPLQPNVPDISPAIMSLMLE